jgi:hypothetical protein
MPTLFERLRSTVLRFVEPTLWKSPTLDSYVRSEPSPQNALDIFAGEWSSRLPPPLADAKAGALQLFEDARVRWAVEMLGGVSGLRILELGPLEGGHTFMLEQAGAAQVIAVEGNTRAYLKCLVTKELLGLRHAQFLCGDFVAYLRTAPRFDVAFASGVLYHVLHPVELLDLLGRTTDKIMLWTHYYDPSVVASRSELRTKFGNSRAISYKGFTHTLYRYRYQKALGWRGFCGGSADESEWLSREDILGALRHFGFHRIECGFDDPHHPNGPAFALIARRDG